jgi:polyisoprenoid-binding protein YceI
MSGEPRPRRHDGRPYQHIPDLPGKLLHPVPIAAIAIVILSVACTNPGAGSRAAAPAPSAGPPLAAPQADAVAAAPSGSLVRFTFQADRNEVRFRAREVVFGQSLPSDAVGATRAVNGTIVLGSEGGVDSTVSRVTADLRLLQSDERRRDNYIQRNTLETDRFPHAEFVPRETRRLPSPLPTSGEVTFDLVGDLTVHGVTRPVAWEVAARVNGPEVAGTGSTRVAMTDFGMTPPRAGPVLSIEDTLVLEIDFVMTRAPSAAERTG